MRKEWPLPDRTCLMRSFPFPTGGNTGSRPVLRLRYFRVGGSLPMRDHAFLAGAVRNGIELHAALARDAPRRRQTLQAVQGRPHHVVRIGRAQALGQDVPDPGAFEHRAHRSTRDHARTRGRRLEQHPARAVLPDDLVRNRAAGERYFGHVAARGFDGLPHRFADLIRLARRDPDLTFTIPHRHQCVEGETATTLHDFRHAIDRDDVLDDAIALALAIAAVAPLTTAAPASAAATAPPAPPAPALTARAARGPVFHRRRCLSCRWNVRRGDVGRRFWTFLLFFH